MSADCIFCKIANGEIPSGTVYEDEDFRVILDISPAAKGHCLILPKQHGKNLLEMDDAVLAKVFPLAKKIGQAMVKATGAKGFNVVQNNGEAAGQTVEHFHVHIIPRFDAKDSMVLWTPLSYEEGELEKVKESIVKEIHGEDCINRGRHRGACYRKSCPDSRFKGKEASALLYGFGKGNRKRIGGKGRTSLLRDCYRKVSEILFFTELYRPL